MCLRRDPPPQAVVPPFILFLLLFLLADSLVAFCYYVSWSLSPKVSFTDALKGPPRRTGLVLACENFFLPPW